ncbi:MAG: winged helix-turn-helix domain-containing protein [Pseudomonadales bacterium]
MEQIKIRITGTAPHKEPGAAWAEELEQNRKRIDEAVKQSLIRQFSKSRSSTVAQDTPIQEDATITLRELAERLKMDRSACRRYVLRLGYKPVMRRTASSGFQEALTFTQAEADAIYARRHADGYC